MQNLILRTILTFAMKFISDMLTKENVQKYGDKIFDLIEDFVADSETTIDDTIVLPIVAKFRSFLDIPDLPDEPRERRREDSLTNMPDPAGN